MRLFPPKRQEERKVRCCRCEVCHHLVEIMINSLEFHAPSPKGKLITEQTEVNVGSDEHGTKDSTILQRALNAVCWQLQALILSAP
jgi:hypothetical protein